MLHPAQLSLHYAVALQALSNLQPATQQVQVCIIEASDASPHLPVGGKATAGHPSQAEVAPSKQYDSSEGSRPQAAVVEGGGHHAEAEEAA